MTCCRLVTTTKSQLAPSRASASDAPGMTGMPALKWGDSKKSWTMRLERSWVTPHTFGVWEEGGGGCVGARRPGGA
jgi:hypothetical protein